MEPRVQRMVRMSLGAVILALVGVGLFHIVRVLDRGPDADRVRAYVLFKDAQGLQRGSLVLYRGMSVGEVADLALDPDTKRVRVLVHLDQQAAPLMRTTTQIWVVRPRFSGIARPLSGLETLIKENYLRLRERPGGEQLGDGDELFGLESQPVDFGEEELEDPRDGDLLATVMLREKFGLRPGNPVLFRGMQTGEVRRVRLAEGGRGILVSIRVKRSFRVTVLEESRFWVSRPILRGNLITGITVDAIDSILESSLVYDSFTTPDSEAAADGAMFVGRAEPPKDAEEWDATRVSAHETLTEPRNQKVAVKELEPWVEVRYRAVEEDLIGDDDIKASGEGVLYRKPSGELLVLVGRSACDGNYLFRDVWYDSLKIVDERVLVVLTDGRVWPARRVWVDPEKKDLAVLQIQTSEQSPLPKLPAWRSYLDFAWGNDDPRALDPKAGDPNAGDPNASDPKKDGDSPRDVVKRDHEKKLPYLLKDGGRAFGIYGKGYVGRKRGPVSFRRVPEALRPGGM